MKTLVRAIGVLMLLAFIGMAPLISFVCHLDAGISFVMGMVLGQIGMLICIFCWAKAEDY